MYQKLEERCYRFAMNHLTQVVQSETFNQIDGSIAKVIIQKVAQLGAFRTWHHEFCFSSVSYNFSYVLNVMSLIKIVFFV